MQLACWLCLVIASCIYIWVITGKPSRVNDSVLAVLGISAGTAVVSSLVSRQKIDAIMTQRVILESQRMALSARIAVLTAASPVVGSLVDRELQGKKNKLIETEVGLTRLPPIPRPRISSGFLSDVLTGEQGISFHRFQMTVWTVVLGLIFAGTVYRELRMPDFAATVVGLDGISAGIYVGFKLLEGPR